MKALFGLKTKKGEEIEGEGIIGGVEDSRQYCVVILYGATRLGLSLNVTINNLFQLNLPQVDMKNVSILNIFHFGLLAERHQSED